MALLSTDRTDLLLDANDDLVVVDGDLAFASGTAGIAQAIRIAIEMFRGEWFLDLDAGVPWRQSILGQKFDPTVARDAFREAILSVDGVADLIDLVVTFDGATRKLTVRWTVRAAFGDTVTDQLQAVM